MCNLQVNHVSTKHTQRFEHASMHSVTHKSLQVDHAYQCLTHKFGTCKCKVALLSGTLASQVIELSDFFMLACTLAIRY